MPSSMIRLTSLVLLTFASVAHAQTSPAPEAPSTTTPNAITPPNGVARGVIRPNRPVDGAMVKRPPTTAKQGMPVISPPGTAR